MVIVIVKTLIYIFAILVLFRWVWWAAAEVKKDDMIDGMNYFELRDEINRLYRNYMAREKRRSMKNDRY